MRKFWSVRNPLLKKEFRGRMRTVRTPVVLLLYLLVLGAGVFGYMYLRYRNQDYYRPGESQELFWLLAVIQMVLIGFVAPGLTAGTISGERERQTLNILLTTHLSPRKIVLSKLTSSLAFTALLVFATLPLFATVILQGGVSPKQMAIVFGYYAVEMLLFGAIGLFCSAWFKRTGVATVVAYGLTLLVLGGTGVLAVFFEEYLQMMQIRSQMFVSGPPPGRPEVFWVSGLNPVLNLMSQFEPGALLMGHSQDGRVEPPLDPGLYFALVYVTLSMLLLYASVRMVMPVKRKLLGRSRHEREGRTS
jgi:ABC-2 type transport system permease protein